jgi:hypothetical protein
MHKFWVQLSGNQKHRPSNTVVGKRPAGQLMISMQLVPIEHVDKMVQRQRTLTLPALAARSAMDTASLIVACAIRVRCAAEQKAGFGRDFPNTNPVLPKPVGRIYFTFNRVPPFRAPVPSIRVPCWLL